MADFIDEATVSLEAGHGGSGCVSLRREKYIPKGGPDGGNGGKGGDIVVLADIRLASLLDFKYKREYLAKKGSAGMGNNRTGKDGDNLILHLPVGTIIKDFATGDLVVDLDHNGQEVCLVKGGRGGKGNAHFKSSTYQTPRFAQPGEEGQAGKFKLELKLLADVGIIGFPNAGKSTLISRVSAARPKVANYPFTTLVPQLGVVQFKGYESFVIADIPGLISGAHSGKGLGIRFLKHVERTSILIHLIDLSPETGRDFYNDYEAINNELNIFNPDMSQKTQVVALNKIDLKEARDLSTDLLAHFQSRGIKAFLVSGATGEGISDLIDYVGERVIKTRKSVANAAE